MKKRLIKVISLISILVLCLLGYYFLNKFYKISIPCIFYEITGFKCPGCGITRCLFSLLNGNIIKALYYNSLVAILIWPFLVYEGINLYRYVVGKSKLKISNVLEYILLVVVIVFGIVRNII